MLLLPANNKISANRLKSEGGFVLIAAILAVMILMAVGFFALTTTTQDVRISSRLVGEVKAFYAAESGLQAFHRMFVPGMGALTDRFVDSVNEPNARYDIGNAGQKTELPDFPAPGFGEAMNYQVYFNTITGRDTSYNTSLSFYYASQYGPVTTQPIYE